MRLAEAQRCPAFENADASTHSTARSRSASSHTTSAFLPPSSRQVLASLRAAASLTARPVAAEPVKLTRSTSWWSTSAAPASDPSPCTTLSTPAGTPASSANSARNDADAGVCSDGFRTAALPQKIAGSAFQATLGSGVLKLVINAATPSGCRIVSTVRCGMLAVVVRPYERRPSPATNSPISTAASVSPSASARDFPGLLDHELGGFLTALPEEQRKLADDVSAVDRSPFRPRDLGCARGRDGILDVIRAGPCDPAQGRLVCGPELLEPLTGASRLEPPVDEVRDARRDYQADQPPSTTTFEPVTYEDASDTRKTTAPSASRASSMRPIGERAAKASRNSGGWSFSTPPSVSVFTRTPVFAQ